MKDLAEKTEQRIRDLVADFVSETDFYSDGQYGISVFIEHYATAYREEELAENFSETYLAHVARFEDIESCVEYCASHGCFPLTELSILITHKNNVVKNRTFTIVEGKRI